MLRTFGAQDVHILDGGLRAWIEAGLPTHSGYVHRAPAGFHAAEKLRHIFTAKGVDMKQPITTACGSGSLLLSSHSAWKSQVQIRSACMTAPKAEYARNPEAVIEKTI